MKFGTSRRLKSASFLTYVMEIFIVIFGITVAYQANVYYEDRKDDKLEIAAIEKLHTENDSNIEEFKSLVDSRQKLEEDTRQLARVLFTEGNLLSTELSHYLFDINQTHKPRIHYEGLNFYLNTNYNDKHSDLKSELVSLKNYYIELTSLLADYVRMKEKYYGEFLVSEVDFGEEKILSLEKIESVEFKNLVVNLLSNEIDLNTLFETAYQKSVQIDDILQEILDVH